MLRSRSPSTLQSNRFTLTQITLQGKHSRYQREQRRKPLYSCTFSMLLKITSDLLIPQPAPSKKLKIRRLVLAQSDKAHWNSGQMLKCCPLRSDWEWALDSDYLSYNPYFTTSLILSAPQFPDLLSNDSNSAYFTGVVWGLSEIHLFKEFSHVPSTERSINLSYYYCHYKLITKFKWFLIKYVLRYLKKHSES